ncbi:hypothetical protein JJ691_47600 [Kutzneria sp. CA-103260]|nr:hypothetical protein JJ691_47600 [Kutzneria sp. CA-103260]
MADDCRVVGGIGHTITVTDGRFTSGARLCVARPAFAACLDVFEDSLPFYQTAQDHNETAAAAAGFSEAISRIGDATVDEPTSF